MASPKLEAENKSTIISVREAEVLDLPGIIALENAMWTEDQRCSKENFASRMRHFKEGFLVAEKDGDIVGTFYGILRPYRLGQPINWNTDSGDGTGATHDPRGNAIFGISITVAHDAPQGTFRKLIEGWRRVAKEKQVDFIFGASRIPGLHRFQGTPEEYVRRIKAGEIFDPVLSKWMACGLLAGKLVPGYFEDPDSFDFGVEVYNDFRKA